MKVRKAIIPAAGLGTRFLPATKATPKEMIPIVDKPTIQYIVEEAAAAGIEDILIISGRNKRAIEDHFDKSYELEEELRRKGKHELLSCVEEISGIANIHYIRQKEAKGLGHAIYCAKSFIGDEPFAVLLGDDIVDSKTPCIKQLMNVYNEYRTTILGVQKVPLPDVSKYGIIAGSQIDERVYKVKGLVEKPEVDQSPSNIAMLGRYIISPRIFEFLEKATPGKGGEIWLTDALQQLMESEAMYAFDFEGDRFDVGDRIGFLKATVEFALKREELSEDFTAFLKDRVERLP
ncbi:UTP--glucose-1-phosphate uridylyltransferase GalU [Ruminiclostridium cellobioparum]|jgi:UTP--glucose-1-phosphate uridylyltransferase|uniref:UTP--glucose-1-phosphate uridylyltransferase n=1 Tax=Ruminiclostridium cellobioparum subsp. termitidis CT1112 TaxID=1195236 RepID=S0FHX3_RUMCE|nr:UTP--glucose-1-phosphate uridylyltransferase GalU [Ruminiclostridium cellobioparum]EMS71395.1 UTP-glucose-1-phosphate uridylyltransferase [Ruminiclostridium cellobioparum subsp. termitidis CT1112]